ncbi:MAG: hypothetical protein AB7G23_20355 [Vicinamibacterales bacterium]
MSTASSGSLVWVRHPDTGAVLQVRERKVRHLAPSGWVLLTDDETTAHEAARAEEKAAARAARRPAPADVPTPEAPPLPQIDSELPRIAPKPRRKPADAPDTTPDEESA